MGSRLTAAAVATAGALAFAGVATAHGDHHGAKGAKVYRATFLNGKAQLVDGRKRNKISIHVRGLTAGVTYAWHIHQVPNPAEDPCMPSSPTVVTPYGDWVYGVLTANAAGNASAKGTSARFDSRVVTGPLYVDVQQSDGTIVACGVLKTKQKKAHEDVKAHEGKGNGHEPGRGRDD